MFEHALRNFTTFANGIMQMDFICLCEAFQYLNMTLLWIMPQDIMSCVSYEISDVSCKINLCLAPSSEHKAA